MDQNPPSDHTDDGIFQEVYECPSTHPEKFGYSSPPPSVKFINIQFMAESHLALSEIRDKLSDTVLNLKKLLINTFLQEGLIESEDDGVFLVINVNEKVQVERN